MKLEGSVATFPLRELVEMVMYSSVTGVLELHTNSGPGRIFFNDGRPYHAIIGSKTGVEAVRELFLDQEAHFLFVADIAADTESLWVDPIELLEECETRARRMAQVQQRVPNLELVPVFVHNPTSPISIGDADRMVLPLINGQRTVQDIADELFCDVIEVCESLSRMIERGQVRLVEASEARAATPSEVPAQSSTPTAERPIISGTPSLGKRRGLLERLLDTLPDDTTQKAMPMIPAPVVVGTTAQVVRTQPDDDPILKLLRGI